MQDKLCQHATHNYADMQHKYVNMQHNYVNMQPVNIIILHVL